MIGYIITKILCKQIPFISGFYCIFPAVCILPTPLEVTDMRECEITRWTGIFREKTTIGFDNSVSRQLNQYEAGKWWFNQKCNFQCTDSLNAHAHSSHSLSAKTMDRMFSYHAHQPIRIHIRIHIFKYIHPSIHTYIYTYRRARARTRTCITHAHM